MSELIISEIINTFGINPEKTGNNPRQWWIVEKLQEGEIRQKVKMGGGFMCANEGWRR